MPMHMLVMMTMMVVIASRDDGSDDDDGDADAYDNDEDCECDYFLRYTYINMLIFPTTMLNNMCKPSPMYGLLHTELDATSSETSCQPHPIRRQRPTNDLTLKPRSIVPVSYTHLTLPTNREV